MSAAARATSVAPWTERPTSAVRIAGASFTQVPDNLAFEDTPAIVVVPQRRRIVPRTIGRTSHVYEEDADLEVEFVDASTYAEWIGKRPTVK